MAKVTDMGHLAVVLYLCLVLNTVFSKSVTQNNVTVPSAIFEEKFATEETGGCGKTEATSGSRTTGRLLVVAMDGSHWISLKAVAEEMGRRGHEVLVLMPEVSMSLGPGNHYTTKIFPVPYTKDLLHYLTDQNTVKLISSTEGLIESLCEKFHHSKAILDMMYSTCESLYYNNEIMQFLRNQKFDAVLTDPSMPIGAILAYNLSVPALYMVRGLACGMDAKATSCPDPPSYVPRYFSKNIDRMNFRKRVLNMVVYLFEPVLCKLIYWGFENVASKFLQRSITYDEILKTAAIWLLRYDFTLEFPKPLSPNMVLVGGINCAFTSPLPTEVLDFVEEAEHGIVIFSLGSLIPAMPKQKAVIFFEAFGRIPQRVLWRYTGEIPDKVPDNVRLMKWLPQNSLLGHPKARAFITHGGSHGIYEGICQSIPMVMLPVFGDQIDNVHRVISRGVGVALDFNYITADLLVDVLNTVIYNSSYKENIMKLSAIHKDRPVEPVDLAVFWTEYVMRHKGADHLRLAARDLNWFHYHSLDVTGFLLVVMAFVIAVVLKSCAMCLRFQKKIQKRKED